MKTYLFDVDGTLYNQPPVRFAMARELALNMIKHPSFSKDIKGISLFRECREDIKFRDISIEKLSEYVAKEMGIDASHFKDVIKKWMFEVPLKYIVKYRSKKVLALMDEAIENGGRIAIYSDYPADEKLEALGLKIEKVYYPSEHTFTSLKPSNEAMEFILKDLGIAGDELIVIGDRDEKDGASARLVGAKYIDVTEIRGK